VEHLGTEIIELGTEVPTRFGGGYLSQLASGRMAPDDEGADVRFAGFSEPGISGLTWTENAPVMVGLMSLGGALKGMVATWGDR
jgi:hypothetical protein